MSPPESVAAETPTPWPPRRVMVYTLVAAATLAGFATAFAFLNVLICLLMGIVIDTALSPLVVRAGRLGVTRVGAAVGVYLLLIAVVLGAIVGGAVPLANQAMTLGETLPTTYQQVREQLLGINSAFIHRLVGLAPEDISTVNATTGVGAEAVEAMAGESQWGATTIRVVFWIGAALLLAFNWTLQKDRTIASLILFMREDKRDATRGVVQEMQDRVGAFVRGQGILCLCVAGLSLIAYWLIGLPNALILALLAGLLELVPYFGPVLSTVPALLVAIGAAPHLVLPVLGVAAAVQFLENNFLVPKIMDKSVGVHPVVTLLALVAFTEIFGFVGMFLAIPLAAVLQVAFDRFVLRGDETEPASPDGRDQASRVLYEARELVQDVQRQVRQKHEVPTTESDEVEDAMEAIAVELERQLSLRDADGAGDVTTTAKNSASRAAGSQGAAK